MAASFKEMMDAANAAVPRITPAQSRDTIAQGNALIVDVRDAVEVEKERQDRRRRERLARPAGISRRSGFSKDKNVIVYCGSAARAALSGKVLKDMGYERVYNLGGFKDWAESGWRSGEVKTLTTSARR